MNKQANKINIPATMGVILGFVATFYVLTVALDSKTTEVKEPTKIVDVYFDEAVTNDSVKPIIKALQKADENTTVVLHIESPGGDVLAGSFVLDALEKTKAKKVISVVNHFAASMAAIIIMHTDEIQANDNAIILFHMYSIDGKKVEPSQDKMMQLFYQQSVAALQSCCNKVLTPHEMYLIVVEKADYTLSGAELEQRLNNPCWRAGI